MLAHRNMASYYVAVRGTGRGSVRVSFLDDAPIVRYDISEEDIWNLSRGLAKLAMLLIAAGAEEVYPSVHGLPVIRNELEAVRWLDDRLKPSSLNLTTVHAFSTCPIGAPRRRCP